MVTREELYGLVWAQPMTTVARRYGVSSSYLARVCAALNVPRPPRGYWQKLAVGKAARAAALPDALPGDQVIWNEKGGTLPARVPPRPAGDSQRRRRIRRGTALAPGTHPLVSGAIVEFRRSRPVEDSGYLKPYKKLLPHVTASGAAIERALDLAGKLYKELERVGARVVIAPADRHWPGMVVDERAVPKNDRQHLYPHSSLWSPQRPTIAFFQDASIAVAVVEMSEEVLLRYVGRHGGSEGYVLETEFRTNPGKYRQQHTWTTTKDRASGRLRIVAVSAEGVAWSRTWQEKGAMTLDASLGRIAKEIRGAIPEVAALVDEAGRLAEIKHQEFLVAEDRRKRKEDRRRIEEADQQSRADLRLVIERWAERVTIERFLEDLSRSIDQLPDAERTVIAERLLLAREFMGTVDPLDFFRTWKTPRELYASIFDSPE